MKNRYLFILMVFIAMVSSCSKDPIISNDKNVGISRITYYANFTLTGSSVMSIIQGSSFTDPGVKAEAAGNDLTVTTSGAVDPNTVGVYVLSYSATNADGFSSSAKRTVIVIPSAEVPGAPDLSGSYVAVPVRTTPGPATISKVAPGVYFSTDLWTGGAVIPGYFICLDGTTLIVPLQGSGYGQLQSASNGTYVNGLITWTITLLDQGPFTATKKWQKK